MATIRRLPSGAWNCQVRVKGFPSVSRTFPTKREAYAWGKQEETAARQGDPAKTYLDQVPQDDLAAHNGIPSRFQTESHSGDSSSLKITDLLSRYQTEVSPTKKNHTREIHQINGISKRLGHLPVTAVTPKTIAAYRDERLRAVSSGTVLRDLRVLSHVFTVALAEWDIAGLSTNPVKLARMPRQGRARDRRLNPLDLERLLQALQGSPTVQSLVALAVETGMRRGELVGLRWGDIDYDKRTVTLYDTKNGEDRVVPLSTKALNLICRQQPLGVLPRRDTRVFPV